MEKRSPLGRIGTAGRKALKPAFTTARFLLCIMIPVSLVVVFLNYSGILYHIGRFLGPVMRFVGLPGEAALVFISSVFINIYSALAVIGTLDLTGREMVVLATMCFMAHNFFVECAVMKKTGSSLSKMVFLRLICAVTAGWVLHIILPSELGKPVHGAPEAAGGLAEVHTIGLDLSGLPFMLRDWFIDSMVQIVRIQLIIFCIMFIQKLLDEFGVMKLLGRIMAPLMGIFGLPRQTGYLWIVANLVGLAYGSAILIEEVRSGAISKTDADLFNHYAGISHSHLEDNLLFVAVGVPLFWAAIPRLLMAILVVWLERFRRFLVLRSYRVRVE